MSKKDSKILFLDDDGQEIEFNVIEQTTIAGQTYLLVEDCEASSEDESVVSVSYTHLDVYKRQLLSCLSGRCRLN